MFALSVSVAIFGGICFKNFSITVFASIYSIVLYYIVKFLFKKNKHIMNRIFICWFIQMAFVIIVYFIMVAAYGVPYDMVGTDDYYSDTEWTDGLIQNGIYSISEMKGNWRYVLFNNKIHLLLIVYMKRICSYIGGYHTLNIRFFNMLLLLIIAMLMGKYAEKNMDASEHDIIKIVTLNALFPNALFISSLVYRDIIVTFFIVVSFYLWGTIKKKKRHVQFLIVIFTVVIMYLTYYTRSQAVLYVGMAIVLGFASDTEENFFTHFNYRKMLVLMAGVGFCCLFGNKLHSEFNRYLIGYNGIHLEGDGFQKIIAGIPLFPFGWILKVLFNMIQPLYYRDIIPVAMLEDPVALLRWFVSWGTVGLLFMYPYIISYWKQMNNIVIMYLFIFISVSVLTSGFRHVMMTYPMLLTMGVLGEKDTSLKSRKSNMLVCSTAIGICAVILITLRIGL